MPEVDALYLLYRDRGVRVVAVGTGDADHVEKIRENKALAVPVPIATDAWRATFGVVAFPETLFVDVEGRVAARLLGGEELPYFEAQVTALLAEAETGEATAAVATADGEGRHSFVARLLYVALHPKKKAR